jgi:hypothetical protein
MRRLRGWPEVKRSVHMGDINPTHSRAPSLHVKRSTLWPASQTGACCTLLVRLFEGSRVEAMRGQGQRHGKAHSQSG